MRKAVYAVAGIAALVLGVGAVVAQSEAPSPPSVAWSFAGPFGTFDRAALQRGFQIYHEVCSNCHSLKLLHYRDLTALGYSEDEIKAFAAEKEVNDLDDEGRPTKRKARPSDAFVPPFPNDQAARAALNGALPPDQSLLVKARDGGADYIYGLLTGYGEAPADMKMAEGMSYNNMFPGHQIAMPPPLVDDSVTYADGTKATVEQEAKDVTTFMAWAADPTMEERKKTGAKVIIFLLVLTLVLYGAKRKIWAALH